MRTRNGIQGRLHLTTHSAASLIMMTLGAACNAPQGPSNSAGVTQLQLALPTVIQTTKLAKLRLHADSTSAKNSDIAHAYLRIREVELQGSNGGSFMLSSSGVELDLMNLTSGLEPLLATARLPEGSYRQIRLITDDSGYVVLKNGVTKNLVVPSGSQSGLKIHFDPEFELMYGIITKVSLDLDLTHSFVDRHTDYLLKPVIRIDLQILEDHDPDGDTEDQDNDCILTDPPEQHGGCEDHGDEHGDGDGHGAIIRAEQNQCQGGSNGDGQDHDPVDHDPVDNDGHRRHPPGRCVAPSPTPTVTASPSPSPTVTGTPSPSPTPTTEPISAPTPSPSQSPSIITFPTVMS